MKISFTRGFDTEAIVKSLKDAKVQGLDEFVSNVAESIDKLSIFVQKNISLFDNVDQQTKSYLMFHGKSILVDPPERRKVKTVMPLQTQGFDNPITSFSWRMTQNGKLELRAFFVGSPSIAQSVTVAIFA